jgi:multidrug resistance efflux pump
MSRAGLRCGQERRGGDDREARRGAGAIAPCPERSAHRKDRAGAGAAAAGQGSVGLAETRLGYATLTSPLTGVVLSHNIEPGEFVAPGTPIVTVGDLEHVWLRAYVDETDWVA